MKLITFLTFSALLTISACSHHNKKSCCADKQGEKMSCTKEDCKKACCDKDKKCADGSCTKKEKACCDGESCHKKKS